MATGDENPGPTHSKRSARSGYQYFFYDKHHCTGPSAAAQWLLEPDLSYEQEFEVFDLADTRELADQNGNLYGMRPRTEAGSVPVLGTRGEQTAKFPQTVAERAWHGFPLWPVAAAVSGYRLRPVPREVLDRMVELGLITSPERSRVRGGKPI